MDFTELDVPRDIFSIRTNNTNDNVEHQNSSLNTTGNFSQHEHSSVYGRISTHHPFFNENFQLFSKQYKLVHYHLIIIVCLFGILSNIFNIIVFSKKRMRSSTNAILLALAVADLLKLIFYFPMVVHHFIPLHSKEVDSYEWIAFLIFKQQSLILLDTISVWLAVTLAVWRFLAISFPLHSKSWCNKTKAKIAIFLNYFCCIIMHLPIYLLPKVGKQSHEGKISYYIEYTEIAKKNDHALLKVDFWILGLATKLIPCIALMGLCIALIRALVKAKMMRKMLKNVPDNDKQHDRTSRMLLAILIFFFITQFPPSVFSMLAAVYGIDFFLNVFLCFVDVMDLLSLTNSSINFIFYCTMNKQFRDILINIFIQKSMRKSSIQSNISADTTV